MATFRVVTYVQPTDAGYEISATSTRADVDHSVPMTDVETGDAASIQEALRIRAELLERVISKIHERGDTVLQVQEIGALDKP